MLMMSMIRNACLFEEKTRILTLSCSGCHQPCSLSLASHWSSHQCWEFDDYNCLDLFVASISQRRHCVDILRICEDHGRACTDRHSWACSQKAMCKCS